MARSVEFYQRCGFELTYGGADAEFSTLRAGEAYVNLIEQPERDVRWWGRAIIQVSDVDGHYEAICSAGLKAEAPPMNAAWGERYFHLTDPDGHELSFAEPLSERPGG